MELYHVPQNGVGLSDNINCPKTITLHDIIPLRMHETVSDRYLRIFNDEMPKILNNCDGIITVSEFSKIDIANEFNFPLEKIFVTPLAAEDIYKPINRSYCKNFIKDKYRISDNFILYVGGYSPRKNIIGIMEAFSLLNYNLRKGLKIVITGKKGLSYERYKNRAIELGISDSVVFTDFIPLEDLPIFYNACEFLIYPSFYEGFGLPPLEAMACGLLPIISNSPVSATKQFALTEKSLFENGNSTDLANKIDYWIEHPEEKAEYSKQYAEYVKNYHIATSIQKFEQMLQTAMDENNVAEQKAVANAANEIKMDIADNTIDNEDNVVTGEIWFFNKREKAFC